MNQSKPKYISVIETYCDLSEAFHFQDDSEKRVGHVVKLSFPSVNRALVQDLLLCNPEKPESKDAVSAAIESVRWEGASSDPIELRGYISVQNKALLQEVLISFTESVEVEIALVIYEYDFLEKKHFKRFYIAKDSVQLVLHEVRIADDPSTYQIKKPRIFEFTMSLMPQENAQAQEICFAFSAKGAQFTRQIGG
jgi:hypothetical protein